MEGVKLSTMKKKFQLFLAGLGLFCALNLHAQGTFSYSLVLDQPITSPDGIDGFDFTDGNIRWIGTGWYIYESDAEGNPLNDGLLSGTASSVTFTSYGQIVGGTFNSWAATFESPLESGNYALTGGNFGLAQAVPEPTPSFFLLLTGCLMGLWRFRKDLRGLSKLAKGTFHQLSRSLSVASRFCRWSCGYGARLILTGLVKSGKALVVAAGGRALKAAPRSRTICSPIGNPIVGWDCFPQR